MRRLAAVLLTSVALGCGGDSGSELTLPPTRTDVAGSYFLRVANGVEVPFTAFTTATEQWNLVRDQIDITADNKWTETTSYVIVSRADSSTSTRETVTSGTYTIANQRVNFVMTTGGSEQFAGAVTDAGLVIHFRDAIFSYVR